MASGIENVRGDMCMAERSEGPNLQADYTIIASNSSQKSFEWCPEKGMGISRNIFRIATVVLLANMGCYCKIEYS